MFCVVLTATIETCPLAWANMVHELEDECFFAFHVAALFHQDTNNPYEL